MRGRTNTMSFTKTTGRFAGTIVTLTLAVLILVPGTGALAQETTGAGSEASPEAAIPNPDTASSRLRADLLAGAFEDNPIPPSDWREGASESELAEYDALAASVEQDEDTYVVNDDRYSELEAEYAAVEPLSIESGPIQAEMDVLEDEYLDFESRDTSKYIRMVEIEQDAIASQQVAEEQASEPVPVDSSDGSSSEPTPTTYTDADSGGGFNPFPILILLAVGIGAGAVYLRSRGIGGGETLARWKAKLSPPPPTAPGAGEVPAGGGPSPSMDDWSKTPVERAQELIHDATPGRSEGPARRKNPDSHGSAQASDGEGSPENASVGESEPMRSVIEEFGYDMTAAARRGEYREMIGREDKLDEMIETLMQSTINNPMIVGEPGTGKTQLVNGFARRLVSGDVPTSLRGKTLVEIRMSSLTAGSQFRGQFEKRIEGLIKEVESEPDRYILFIDEIHTIMGAGVAGGEGSDASNVLKTSLSSGKMTVIGATTAKEVRIIEKDGAMMRRFSKLDIPALTVEETMHVLQSRVPVEEKRHGIVVEPEALEATAKFAERYIQDEYLPGSAVKLLAKAAARVSRLGKPSLTPEDVAASLSASTGLKVGSVSGDEAAALGNLAESLRSRVIGQDEAVSAVAEAVIMQRAGLTDGKPPSLFLTGPTGTGKTELATSLAREMFGDENRLIRLDMSGYSIPESVTKLIGSPPGYHDSDKGGALTEAVRRRPYSVVLFDEVEKCHMDVWDLFLQMLDDGQLSDSLDRKIDFSNCILIFTSNLAQGPGDAREALVSAGVRPEIVARFDSVIRFSQLSRESVREIISLMVSKVKKKVSEDQGGVLTVSDAALAFLSDRGFDPRFGARPAAGAVSMYLSNALAPFIIGGKVRGKTIAADLSANGDRLVFEVSDITPAGPDKDLPCAPGEAVEDAPDDAPESRETARTRPPASWPGME